MAACSELDSAASSAASPAVTAGVAYEIVTVALDRSKHLQSTAASILDIESKLAVALLLWPKYELGELTTRGLAGPSGAGTTDIADAKVSRDAECAVMVQVRRREAACCLSTKACSYIQSTSESGTPTPIKNARNSRLLVYDRAREFALRNGATAARLAIVAGIVGSVIYTMHDVSLFVLVALRPIELTRSERVYWVNVPKHLTEPVFHHTVFPIIS